jgi:integrase
MAKYKLTDAGIKYAGPGDHYDGEGLFIRVKGSGTRSWFFQWTAPKGLTPRRPKMGLGPYPAISLAKARDKADKCRALVVEGIDPREQPAVVGKPETFMEASHKLFALKRDALKGGGEAGRWMSTLDHHVFPMIGDRYVVELSLDDLVAVLKPIWGRDIGRKAINKIDQVMTNAQARNPAVMSDVGDITKALKALLPQVRRANINHPALPWDQMPALWLALGDSVAHMALKFYLLNIPRTSNVTGAGWSEIDWKAGIWDIPGENMKTDVPFAAPLTTQSLALLRDAQKRLSVEGSDHIFPSPQARKKGVVSENTWGKWLRENDWKAADGRAAVAHGFRATFGTWCGDNEICDHRMAARCIQHKVESKQDAAYLRSKLLTQRLRVMQAWADFVTSGAAKVAEGRAVSAAQRARLDALIGTSGQTLRDVEEWTRGNPDEHREARAMADEDTARKEGEADSLKRYHYDQED